MVVCKRRLVVRGVENRYFYFSNPLVIEIAGVIYFVEFKAYVDIGLLGLIVLLGILVVLMGWLIVLLRGLVVLLRLLVVLRLLVIGWRVT